MSCELANDFARLAQRPVNHLEPRHKQIRLTAVHCDQDACTACESRSKFLRVRAGQMESDLPHRLDNFGVNTRRRPPTVRRLARLSFTSLAVIRSRLARESPLSLLGGAHERAHELAVQLRRKSMRAAMPYPEWIPSARNFEPVTSVQFPKK
jgi:hypothetical protein